MITSLRNRHRIIITALAFLVPIAFVSGLMVRKPIPPSGRLPEIHAGAASEQASVIYEDKNLWEGLSIITRVVATESDRSNLFLELQGTPNLTEPDVFIYWCESQPLAEGLPENAVLLGKLSGMRVKRLSLPVRALAIRGHLTIYSLAHRKIVATAELPTPGSRLKGGSQ